MRVLFAHPFFLKHSALEQRWLTPYPPLGLLYLAAAARAAGHAVSFFDGTFADDEAQFQLALRSEAPEVVCFGSLVTLRPAALRLAEAARRAGCRTVAGGPDATAAPGVYAAAVDAVVKGEGERALVSWLEGGAAARGVLPAAELVEDLNALPRPARDLIDMPRYFGVWRQAHGYTSVTLAASRGCPFGCQHCAEAAAGPHWRVRTPANVAAEMRDLEALYQPDRFRLVDDLDGLGRDWLIALAEAMQAAGVTTPYEGLRLHVKLGDLPMLAREKELCADRNAWIPKAESHPHAPPALLEEEVRLRWGEARLPEGAALADP